MITTLLVGAFLYLFLGMLAVLIFNDKTGPRPRRQNWLVLLLWPAVLVVVAAVLLYGIGWALHNFLIKKEPS